MNRFQTAIAIQDACNPSGIAHALLDAMREARAEGQFMLTEDPAVWLIVHKLATLFPWIVDYSDPEGQFHHHWQTCQHRIHPTKEPDYVEDTAEHTQEHHGHLAPVHLG